MRTGTGEDTRIMHTQLVQIYISHSDLQHVTVAAQLTFNSSLLYLCCNPCPLCSMTSLPAAYMSAPLQAGTLSSSSPPVVIIISVHRHLICASCCCHCLVHALRRLYMISTLTLTPSFSHPLSLHAKPGMKTLNATARLSLACST